MMSSTGDKPGAGIYTCNNCGQIVTLEDDKNTLPPSSSCKELEYTP
jgi:hypothetical protein